MHLGNNTRYYMQLLKTVQAFSHFISNDLYTPAELAQLFEVIRVKIIPKALKASYRLYEHANRAEYNTIRNILDRPLEYVEQQSSERSFIYRNTSAGTEARELLVSTLYLSLQINMNDLLPEIDQLCDSSRVITTMNLYIKELGLKARRNYFDIELLIGKELLLAIKEQSRLGLTDLNGLIITNEIHNLCVDSIYCYAKMLQYFKIAGINYINTTHSSLAQIHERMGFWCEWYLLIKRSLNLEERIGFDRMMMEILETSDLNYITPWLHYEMAIREYHKAIEVHHEGLDYKDLIRQLYYLDDDFDDSVLHYSLAIERYQMNTGNIRSRIARLNQKLSDHHLYKFETYFA